MWVKPSRTRVSRLIQLQEVFMLHVVALKNTSVRVSSLLIIKSRNVCKRHWTHHCLHSEKQNRGIIQSFRMQMMHRTGTGVSLRKRPVCFCRPRPNFNNTQTENAGVQVWQLLETATSEYFLFLIKLYMSTPRKTQWLQLEKNETKAEKKESGLQIDADILISSFVNKDSRNEIQCNAKNKKIKQDLFICKIQ